MPPEYKKWVPIVMHRTIKCVIIVIAVVFQRIIAAVHSAVKDGQMLGVGLVRYNKGV